MSEEEMIRTEELYEIFESGEPEALDDSLMIEDAALASAWIHPNGVVHVWRDESDPNLWHVETELISHDFERVFRSDIAERVRDYLRKPKAAEEERTTRAEPAEDD